MNFKLKILVTGNNKRIGRDICDHCEEDRGYLTVMCRPEKEAIFDVVYSEMPNVVIICMNNETAEDVAMYNLLFEANKNGAISVFVVVDDDDKAMFMRHSKLKKVYFLSRPVSLFAVYEKLISLEEELSEKKKNNEFFIEQYVNPDEDNGRKRKRILVVDDDTQQLLQIKEQLDEFYDVSVVKSGEACMKFLSKKDVDLILLDYMMPEVDGPTVLMELREYEETYQIPVIFLSGITEKERIIETITELKPQGYIVKPAKKSELVAKIIDVLG